MKLLSVNVGLPREVSYRERTYATAIFKAPVAGRVPVTRLNIEGDRQGTKHDNRGPRSTEFLLNQVKFGDCLDLYLGEYRPL